MAALGVADHRILGFPDGALADHDAAGLTAIGRLLDDVQPDTILTFGPNGITFHPDHVAVSRWVTAAWEQRGRPCRLLYATFTPEHLARRRRPRAPPPHRAARDPRDLRVIGGCCGTDHEHVAAIATALNVGV